MFNKKNLPLFIGFAIPVAMILFVAIAIYVPGIFNKPKVDFLYSTNQGYYADKTYNVANGRLQEVAIPNPNPSYPYPGPQNLPTPTQLYVHDVTTNRSRLITLEDAQALNLDPSTTSPDGFKLENGSGGGDFLFGGSRDDYYTNYLVGHNVSKKMNVTISGPKYYDQVHFIGWIIE